MTCVGDEKDVSGLQFFSGALDRSGHVPAGRFFCQQQLGFELLLFRDLLHGDRIRLAEVQIIQADIVIRIHDVDADVQRNASGHSCSPLILMGSTLGRWRVRRQVSRERGHPVRRPSRPDSGCDPV